MTTSPLAVILDGESTAEAARQAAIATTQAAAATASASAASGSAVAAQASASDAETTARHQRWLREGTGRGPRSMAAPPTVTSGAARTLPRSWLAATGSVFYSMSSTPVGGYFTYTRTVPKALGVGVLSDIVMTTGTGAPNAVGMLEVSFLHDGSAVELGIYSATGLLVLVDDEYVSGSLTPTVVNTPGQYIKLDFGTRAVRRIAVRGQNLYFMGAVTGFTDAIYPAPVRGPRVMCGIDSFSGAGVENWHNWLSDCMGWDDVRCIGVGGTGYVATNGGAAKKLRDRLATDVIPFSPDILMLMGSINDGAQSAASVQSEAQAVVEQVLAALPDCLVIGGYNATGGIEKMTAAHLDVMDATKAGFLAGGGVWLNPIEMPISFSGAAPSTTVAAAVTAAQAGNAGTPETASAATGIPGTTQINPATNALPFAGAVIEIGSGAGRERVAVTTAFQQSGSIMRYGFDGTARYAHSIGEPMVMKGPSYLTGQGRVGAPTGYGNADLFVGPDNVHPSAAGHRAIAQVQAAMLRQYLAGLA